MSAKSTATFLAFATPPNSHPIGNRSGVEDFCVVIRAIGTSHSIIRLTLLPLREKMSRRLGGTDEGWAWKHPHLAFGHPLPSRERKKMKVSKRKLNKEIFLSKWSEMNKKGYLGLFFCIRLSPSHPETQDLVLTILNIALYVEKCQNPNFLKFFEYLLDLVKLINKRNFTWKDLSN